MQSVTQDETYNGWKNYPTWAVNLWLSNDEGLYRETTRRVMNTAQEARLDDRVIEGIWTAEESVRFNTADMLKDFVEELAAEEHAEASFVADLIGYALGCVDWDEIATAWLEEV